jgi:hypothetical protein
MLKTNVHDLQAVSFENESEYIDIITPLINRLSLSSATTSSMSHSSNSTVERAIVLLATTINLMLKLSPTFISFLLYKKATLNDYIDEITITNISNNLTKTHHIDPETKKLKIRLDRYWKHNVDLMSIEKIREKIKQKNIPFRTINTTDLEITLTECILTGQLTPKEYYKSAELKSLSLDPTLIDIEDFKSLPESIKARIVNLDFIKQNKARAVALAEKINLNTQTIIQDRINQIDISIEKRMSRISDKQQSINQLIQEVADFRIKKVQMSISITEKINEFQKTIPELIRILPIDGFAISQSGTVIEFLTKPLFLNFDEDLLNAIPDPKREAIKQGYRMSIGRHIITINLGSLNIGFRRFDDKSSKNNHVESYTCYGTFQDSLLDAQLNNDLIAVVHLAFQIIQNVTPGDVAGRDTINQVKHLFDSEGFKKGTQIHINEIYKIKSTTHFIIEGASDENIFN